MHKRLPILFLLLNVALVGCTGGASDELSDDQKLKQAASGREAYSQGMQGGNSAGANPTK